MSLAYCVCGTAYAPDLDECPHCGSTDTRTEEYHVNKITDSGVSHVSGDEPTSWQSDLAFTPGRDVSPHDPLAQKHVPAVSDPVEDPYEKAAAEDEGSADAAGDTAEGTDVPKSAQSDDGSDSTNRSDVASGTSERELNERADVVRPDEPVHITKVDEPARPAREGDPGGTATSRFPSAK